MSVHTHGNTLFSIFLECIIKIRWNICKSFVVCKIRKLFIPGVSVQKRHTFSFHLLLINHSSKKHCQTDSAPHFMQLAAILQAL